MAVERVRDGERPSSVIASFGFHRTTIYQWLSTASKPGGTDRAALQACDRAATQFDATPGATGVSLDQRLVIRVSMVWILACGRGLW